MDSAHFKYQKVRQSHWNSVARSLQHSAGWGVYYHRRLTRIYESLVHPGQSILEIGCARGDLLAALKPSFGVGVDFSEEMIHAAQERHPNLRFILADAHELEITGTFDVIILSDLVIDLWDVQTVLEKVSRLMTPRSRLIINSYSRLWEPLLKLAELLALAKPTLYQNWLTVEDIGNLLRLANCEVIK